jgi:hypothetical protein
MTFTLGGRLQTRLVLLSSIGVIWTLMVSPFLPRPPGMTIHETYQITLQSSLAMAVLGIAWEFIYHGLQQLRWDKDWPPLLSLLTGAVEAVPVWLVLHALGSVPGDGGWASPILPLYSIHFASTWLVVWSVSVGPIQVIQPRWRFEGGTFSGRPPDGIMAFVVTNIGMAFTLVILWAMWI